MPCALPGSPRVIQTWSLALSSVWRAGPGPRAREAHLSQTHSKSLPGLHPAFATPGPGTWSEAQRAGLRGRPATCQPCDSGTFLSPLSLDFSQLSNGAEGCQEGSWAPITSQEMRDGRLPIFPSFTLGWPGPEWGCTLPPPLQAARLPLNGAKCLGT